jgi:hypothetical protein
MGIAHTGRDCGFTCDARGGSYPRSPELEDRFRVLGSASSRIICRQGVTLMYSGLRFLPTLYRRSLYNLVCALGVLPLIYQVQTAIFPRLVLRSKFDGLSIRSENSDWEFITIVTLTGAVNIILYPNNTPSLTE